MHNWAGQPRPIRGTFRVDGPRGVSRYRFWWLRPDRYRLEETEGDRPGSITVRSDREVWSIRPRHVFHRREAAGSLTVLDNLLMSPLGELAARPPVLKGTTTVAGRDAAVVVAKGRHFPEEIEAAVDLGAGVTLRRIRLRAGKPTVRMEIEEIEIDADLPGGLFSIDLPSGVPVTELESKARGFPLVEDLTRLLPFEIWVPKRPRDLVVVSKEVEADSLSVKLVWVEDRGGERGVMVDAEEGAAADESQFPELEQVDVDGLAVFVGIDQQTTPETWIVRFQKGATPIRLAVRGSRDQALESAVGLIPLSGDRPKLGDR
jgi:outer membrane lipoprotein-sorting protein